MKSTCYVLGLSLLAVFPIGKASAKETPYKQQLKTLSSKYLKEFDQKLDDPITSDLAIKSKAYIKLQILHENFHNPNPRLLKEIKQNSKNKDDAPIEQKIDEVIDNTAESEAIKEQLYKELFKQNDDVIFASEEKNGNVTGAEYPDKTWSLTFDDGPEENNTPKVLDELKKRDIKATFFMVGNALNVWPATANLVKMENMEIASHSYTHAALSKPETDLNKEVKLAKELLEKKLGVDIELMRLPYGDGVYNSRVRKALASNDLIHIYWNVDSVDWQDPNPETVFQRVKKQVEAIAKNSKKDAGIILFHDRKTVTPKASSMVMDYLKSRKVKFCTVGSVIEQINKKLESCN